MRLDIKKEEDVRQRREERDKIPETHNGAVQPKEREGTKKMCRIFSLPRFLLKHVKTNISKSKIFDIVMYL